MVTAIVIVVVLVAGVVGYAASQPTSFRISRSLSMKAAPASVFGHVADLHKLNAWNPFALQDPAIKLTYSGAEQGQGAAYDWDGPKSGNGRMEILDARPSKLVAMKLDFNKPFVAHNLVDFTFEETGGATTVTWAMRGERNLMMKLMGVFMSMDKMVGGEFEKGLRNLKTIVEGK